MSPVHWTAEAHQITLHNEHLTVTYHLQEGWLAFRAPGGQITNARWAVEGERDGQPWHLTSDQAGGAIWHQAEINDIHGHGQLAIFDHPSVPGGSVTLEMKLYDEHPFVLFRLSIHNQSSQPWTLHRATPLRAEAQEGSIIRLGDGREGALAFLRNGWHSWSYTAARQADEAGPHTRLNRLLGPAIDDPMTPMNVGAGRFWSHTFGLLGDREAGQGVVLGFVSLADQFGRIFVDCRAPSLRLETQMDGIPLVPGRRIASEWAYVQFTPLPPAVDDPLAVYAAAAGRQMQARVPQRTPVGWSSWYCFFDKVSEADVRRNLDALARLREEIPVDVVQLDDGYERAPGDWLETNRKFPAGLADLAQRIRARGFRSGLWLAPLIVRPDSRLIREYPNWLLRDERGRPVSAGFLWNHFCRALDPTHPEVQAWLARIIRRAVTEWGFDYLKLDFLYAGALPGRHHDPSMTRAQALRKALEIIREAAGEHVFLVGCGCPLGPGVGLLDAMRIGPDVDPHWVPHYFGRSWFVRDEPTMPAARNAIRNILTRSTLHRRWWINDPDCLLVRDQDSHLTEAEVRSLASLIGLSGGLLVLSDDMPQVSEERRRYIQPLLPVMPESAVPVDLLDREMPERYLMRIRRPWGEWTVLAASNWSDTARSVEIELADLGLDPDRPYHVFNFWDGIYQWVVDGRISLPRLEAHDTAVLGIRPVQETAHLVGTTFHISQGGELADWEMDEAAGRLRFRVPLGRRASGEVWVYLPGTTRSEPTVTCNGEPVIPQAQADAVWMLPLEVDGEAVVEVTWTPQ